MKTTTQLYKVITTLILSIIVTTLSAQFVTVPDTNFATYLGKTVPSAMVGNQMDTTNSAVLKLRVISVENLGIKDMTGIQYFKSLTTLDCGNGYATKDSNIITILTNLPNTIDTIICSNTRLDSLISLPTALVYLLCSDNRLTKLRSLPKGLVYLDCSGNPYLDSLPALDSSMTYLNCFDDGLSSLPALPVSLVSLECDLNNLSTLPALHDSLTSIICSQNAITILPTLPLSLTFLCCSTNQLASLPALPAALQTLKCYQNQLTSLPALDTGLTYLDCSRNMLTVLPALSASLSYLDCSSNKIISLPSALSPSLTYLECSNNQLTTLPPLSAALTYVDCSSNLLTSLSTVDAVLGTLICSSNQLPLLPALNSSLSYLDCQANQLTTLPTLDPGLSTLLCAANLLPSLPALPANLSVLDCSMNPLPVLPALPSNLSSLTCMQDKISTLPALPGFLQMLNCSYNNLSAGLPALPNSITSLNCYSDSLTSLPVLPNALSSLNCTNNSIACFPVFPISLTDTTALNIYGNPFHCLPNYVRAMTIGILNYSLCGIGNVNGCPTAEGVVGFAYKDKDANCTKDTSDINLLNIPMSLYDSKSNFLGMTFTAGNGVYDFPDSNGTYKVVVDTASMPFQIQCAHPGGDSVVAVSGLDTNVNFSLTCKPGFDVGVQSIVNMGQPFPGAQHELSVVAGDMSQWYNLGCASGISGYVKITVYGPVSYAGYPAGSIAPFVSGNTYSYSIADFGAINNQTAFGLLFNTAVTAASGDSISVTVTVTPGADNNPANNTMYYCYYVLNSHDPNVKTTSPIYVPTTYTGSIIYTIFFQNTGTAAARNILIADTLDKYMDITTFNLINYSHHNTAHLKGRVLNVEFNNINLPDSSSDPKGSVGFVQYSIKPVKGVPFLAVAKNTGYIYFDYNAPVITNTTLNHFTEGIPASVNNAETETGIKVFPNPSNGEFTIQSSVLSGQPLVEVYNVLGEKIFTTTMIGGNAKVNISGKAAGLYLYRIVNENGTLVSKGKLIIQ